MYFLILLFITSAAASPLSRRDDNTTDHRGLFADKPNNETIPQNNGQCTTNGLDDKVYCGAKDGIYKYNKNDNKVEKHGTVTESVIKMWTEPKTGIIYYLTEDFVLYKFDKDGVNSSKVDAVKNARTIAFDYEGNLYFHDGENQVYVYDGEKVKKIEGLPAHPDNVGFMVVHSSFGTETFAIFDGSLYKVTKAGTSEKTSGVFEIIHNDFGYQMK